MSSKRLMRVLAVFLLLMFFALVWMVPEDKFLSQDFYFKVSDESPGSDWQWNWFVEQQKLEFFKLARLTAPLLSKNISIIAEDDSGPTLGDSEKRFRKMSFRLRCRNKNDDELINDFRKVIASYVDQRNVIEKNWQNGIGSEIAMGCASSLRMWLDKVANRDEELRQQLVMLHSDEVRISASSIALKHQLRTKRLSIDSRGFMEFIKPYLEKSLDEDGELKRFGQELCLAIEEIGQFDIKAGECDSAEQLENLDQQRESLNQRRQHLQQSIDQRIQQITAYVKDKEWAKYQKQVKAKISEKESLINDNAESQFKVSLEREHIKDRTSFVREFLPEELQDSTNELAKWRARTEIRPVLRKPIASYSLQTRISVAQYLVLGISIFAGIGFALVVHTCFGSGKKAKGDYESDLEEPFEGEQTEVAGSEFAMCQADIKADDASTAAVACKASADWAQQYDSACQAIFRLREQIECPIVMVGAVKAEEASVRASVNLAISLTRSNKLNVLMIEADQSSGELAAIFDYSTEPGFFEWRRGEKWASQVIKQTQLPLLSFMAAGIATAQQCDEQLDLSRETHRWSNLRGNYDVILLYCKDALTDQPQSPEQYASAKLLELSDGVFGMVRTKRERSSRANQIEGILKDRAGQFLGFLSVNP